MKTLILNGSPRKGNTLVALENLKAGIVENLGGEVEMLDVAKYKVAGCMGCEYCKKHSGECVTKDDGEMFAKKIVEADNIIFGTPVYWWGVTAQLKAVIDRMYMKGGFGLTQPKKIGVIAIGAAELEDAEYEIISKQFKCICEYLGWKLVVDESISAAERDELSKNEKKLAEIRELYKKFTK